MIDCEPTVARRIPSGPPWGDMRNFLVPTADPRNPVFETAARDARAYGVGVLHADKFEVTLIDYENFCAVSVRERLG